MMSVATSTASSRAAMKLGFNVGPRRPMHLVIHLRVCCLVPLHELVLQIQLSRGYSTVVLVMMLMLLTLVRCLLTELIAAFS